MKILVILLVSFSITFSQYEDTGKRGIYFSKKTYSEASIPAFKENRAKLPSPILENNPDYVELYWKAWSLAFDHFKHPPQGSPFVSNYIDEGFSPSIFQWDTIFMLMFARYGHSIFPAIQSLDNFYCRQYENGYICREIQEASGKDYVFIGREHTINPPLFAWAEVESYKVTGDKSRFEAVVPVIKKYAEWLEKYRRKENTKHNLFWNTGLGSGMDNIPLQGSGWADMSSQMVLMYRNLAFMCHEISQNDEATKFEKHADEISERINQFMWNEEDGFYYNVDDNGIQQRVKTVAGFWPMLAGVANQHQAERLLIHLQDPKSFWRTIPFPSLAANEKEYRSDGTYWVGGVWASTNVMIIKGLDQFEKIGDSPTNHTFTEFATEATEKYLDGLYKVYQKTGTLWENYSPDLMMRGSPSQSNFVGWTGCGPIELLIENVIGLHPDGAHNILKWNIARIDRHGIEQLKFGDVTVTVICQKRESVVNPAEVHVITNKPFTLIVSVNGREKKELHIQPGSQKFTVQ
ncbi:MAG: trehalase family glycosidase [Bacteroidota bacterium]|nr:trehalase family glycosidase [Bacteroidota bacterium]